MPSGPSRPLPMLAALVLLAGAAGLAPAGPARAQPAGSAQAQQGQPQAGAAAPRRLGEHGSWTAATHAENGQKVCYAFAKPSRSEPARQGVLLTVTHRPGQRDAVILTAGYRYAPGAEVKVSIGPTELPFYTAASAAAARDHAAAIRAFRNGREAVARGPGANGRGTVTDTFPLAGFGAAYDAISRECPAQGGGGGAAPPRR